MRYILGLETNAITTIPLSSSQTDMLISELMKSANGAARKVGNGLMTDVPEGTSIDLTVDLYHAELIADAIRLATA